MANPLQNEEEIYERIKKEKLKIDPIIWELINHHIRNDVNVISIAIGDMYLLPPWILKWTSRFISFLYKISRLPGNPDYDLQLILEKSLERTKTIDKFLKKIHNATRMD